MGELDVDSRTVKADPDPVASTSRILDTADAAHEDVKVRRFSLASDTLDGTWDPCTSRAADFLRL